MNVLIIAKYYPPLLSAQALQAVKVAESLVLTGVNVYVIAGTTKDIVCNSGDQNSHAKPNVTYVKYNEGSAHSIRIIHKFKRALKEVDQVNPFSQWVNEAYRACSGILEHINIDVLLTQSTPFDSHLAGLMVKSNYDLKWVASFSDPFPIHIAPAPYRGMNYLPLLGSFQISALRKVLKRADSIHVTSSLYAAQLMQDRSGVNILDRTWVIPHIGFKPSNVEKCSNGLLAHIGHLTRERSSKELLIAVQESISILKSFRGLLCIGRVCNEFQSMVSAMGMKSYVHSKGQMSPEECQTMASSASALLVIEADMQQSPFLPSKFADYAAIEKPIIAITPRISPIKSYIDRFGGGYAITHDVGEIRQAIESVFQPPTDNSLNQYVRSELATRFSSEVIGQEYMAMLRSI